VVGLSFRQFIGQPLSTACGPALLRPANENYERTTMRRYLLALKGVERDQIRGGRFDGVQAILDANFDAFDGATWAMTS
jgi:hypothetical protein